MVLLGSSDEIVEQFKQMDARIVFSAEPYCWPDESLADNYPITESRYKYLNSGGMLFCLNNYINFFFYSVLCDVIKKLVCKPLY